MSFCILAYTEILYLWDTIGSGVMIIKIQYMIAPSMVMMTTRIRE